jgi:pilus assembly protein CpaE
VKVLGSKKQDGGRATMKVMLVGNSPDQRAPLKAVLDGLTEPKIDLVESEPESAASLPENASSPPDVTMVLVNGNQDLSFKFLTSQAQHSPRPMLFAVLTGRSPAVMKQALRSGADEILFAPLDPGETTRALLKISETRRRTERGEGGIVCSLASIVGGVGVTSLAANLGLALQSLHQRVALVDLDFQAGGLAIYLNLDPEMTIMPLVRLERKLDSIQLESALTRHESGLYLLAAPKRIEESEAITEVTVGLAIDLMRQMFDFVIVDCGDQVDENTVAAWERSENLFYVLNQSIAAARCAWRFVDLFERLGLTSLDPKFILDRYNPVHPLGEKEIETTLSKKIFAKIPADDRTFERIEMKAQDLFTLAPSSPPARAILELATRMLPASGETVGLPEPGLVARLRSAFNPH